MDDFLEKLLEESVNGKVVLRHELSSEEDRVACHAQLARLTREARSFRLVPVERTDDERE